MARYEIHGTNNPTAVGLAITHGCIRMYPEDVAALFPLLPVGTPVRLSHVPVKWPGSTAIFCSKRTHPSMRRGKALNPMSISFPTFYAKQWAMPPSPFIGTTRER